VWELILFEVLLNWREFNPDKLNRSQFGPIWSSQQRHYWHQTLIAGAFNKLGQYANSSDNRAYCYTELAISTLVVAIIVIAGMHFDSPDWLPYIEICGNLILAWTTVPNLLPIVYYGGGADLWRYTPLWCMLLMMSMHFAYSSRDGEAELACRLG